MPLAPNIRMHRIMHALETVSGSDVVAELLVFVFLAQHAVDAGLHVGLVAAERGVDGIIVTGCTGRELARFAQGGGCAAPSRVGLLMLGFGAGRAGRGR